MVLEGRLTGTFGLVGSRGVSVERLKNECVAVVVHVLPRELDGRQEEGREGGEGEEKKERKRQFKNYLTNLTKK